jgi:hypothetical protein
MTEGINARTEVGSVQVNAKPTNSPTEQYQLSVSMVNTEVVKSPGPLENERLAPSTDQDLVG